MPILQKRQLKKKDRVLHAPTMKFDFVTIASHQLRTPLSAMKWFLEMMLEGNAGKLNKKQNDFLIEIYKSNERMIRLVNDLLMVSKIQDRSLKLVCRSYHLEPLLNAIIKEQRPLMNAAQITVVTKYDTDSHTEMYGDEDKIKQVFTSLFDNAIRYMINGGLIVVKMNKTNSSVAVEIQDTGVGIPSKERKQIFKQFFRGSNIVRMKTEGTGLGLFIAKSVIELSGGNISFSSQEGKGSSFTITLPLAHGASNEKK